ncbi:DUF6192 family protein [Nonomuraea sp. NPDC050547]|uniref:DUF6192 family protein n=1 Tax=Nonomuraea sp. NPDC050547 TaxID=3364368 RepID=UPI0037AC839E
MSDPEQRFAAIETPPKDECTGLRRWTEAAVKQVAGRQFADRASVQQKIDRIHDLARDEQVAAAVATDLLRRPAVVAQVITDDTARHLVNRAQADQARQAAQAERHQLAERAAERARQHTDAPHQVAEPLQPAGPADHVASTSVLPHPSRGLDPAVVGPLGSTGT